MQDQNLDFTAISPSKTESKKKKPRPAAAGGSDSDSDYSDSDSSSSDSEPDDASTYSASFRSKKPVNINLTDEQLLAQYEARKNAKSSLSPPRLTPVREADSVQSNSDDDDEVPELESSKP